MRTSEKEKQGLFRGKITYDPSLDNLPLPKAAVEKAARARKFLEEHPIPEHILKR
ncbi:hypothetical protein DYBT9623_02568 [Dyadobacter sp. CECT 9623]|uniref:Uncharacterized protein n=1 Tax=Dyadobacter linearis TaxID=2823330 RepID=A0ABN7R6X6_9BACT|nr:hypothetical protein [Dyadobacter sp. CECT 9623]CAG5069831.1 hypothetical protein DYBT9623_02568 [Dyadobacter sp. CECT 9623]